MQALPPESSNLPPVLMQGHTLYAAGVLLRSLRRSGVLHVVLSPGSRSAPLALAADALAADGFQTHVVLDERSAGFYALGLAKASGKPAALVCTSGSALAHYLPAVMEAKESGTPLVVLSADRPPELQHAHTGQTLNQSGVFAPHICFEAALPVPQYSEPVLMAIANVGAEAVKHAVYAPGPVHLNVPLRAPLNPVQSDAPPAQLLKRMQAHMHHIQPVQPAPRTLTPAAYKQILTQLKNDTLNNRGIILAGNVPLEFANNPQAYCKAVETLSAYLGWPVLDGGLTPLRSFRPAPFTIARAEAIAQHAEEAVLEALQPRAVLQLGPPLVGKYLRLWLERCAPALYALEPTSTLGSAHMGASIPLGSNLQALAAAAEACMAGEGDEGKTSATPYTAAWQAADAQATTPTIESNEAAFVQQLAGFIPEGSVVHIAASSPVRHVEAYWPPTARGITFTTNRGTNGIDGTLATAFGLAKANPKSPVYVLAGDLACAHDVGSLALASAPGAPPITIICLNNNGGHIFAKLPVASTIPPETFQRLFLTPQTICFKQAAAAYGVAYAKPSNTQAWEKHLSTPPQYGQPTQFLEWTE